MGTRTLSVVQFVTSASGTAQGANDWIVCETGTGKLLFDSNGSAAGSATLFSAVDRGSR